MLSIKRLLSLTLLLIAVPLPCFAQQTKIDPASMVPSQTLASVSLWPKELAASQNMRFAPREVVSAFGLENIGLDPLEFDRIDVMIGMIGPMGPQLGALIQSSKPIDLSALNPDVLQSSDLIDDDGFKYLAVKGPEGLIIHQVNPNVIVVGTNPFAKSMIKSPAAKNDVAGVLSSIKSKQDALAIVSVKALRPLLEGFAETAPLPPEQLEDLNTLIAGVEFAALRLQVGADEKIQLVVSGTDPATAANVATSLKNILKFAVDTSLSQMQAGMNDDSPTSQAMLAYTERMGKEILTTLEPTKNGKQLVFEIKDFKQINLAATMAGVLLPAIQTSRVVAFEVEQSNNLRQLGLALHNFHDAFRSFPTTAGIGDDGKPMLSWRVAILPYLGENELYQRFNLDEPWDSEQNRELLAEMPNVYRHPNRNTQPGYTVYQAPINDRTLLRLDETASFRNVTDGTSNTIMLVETSEELAVPWTAPQDYELDMENPSAGLFVNGILTVLFGDGSTSTLAESEIELDTLRALFTRDGGEVVQRP